MSFGTRNRAIASRARQRFEPSVVLPEVDYLESRIIIGKRYNFLKHRDPVRFNENQLSRADTYDGQPLSQGLRAWFAIVET